MCLCVCDAMDCICCYQATSVVICDGLASSRPVLCAVNSMRGPLHRTSRTSQACRVHWYRHSVLAAPRRAALVQHASQGSSVSIHGSSSLLDHLILTIDGFVAQKAVATYPDVAKLKLEPAVRQNLDVIQSLVPARIQGQLFNSHPQLLAETDMQSWVDFLTSFGFADTQIADLLRSTPEVFYNSTVFQAGQLLLFLRQNLHVSDDAVISKCLKWAAALQPDTTQASMAAVAQCLQQQCKISQDQLLSVLQTFPAVLGWNVETDILPKLHFFQGLGREGQQVLDNMYDMETGWLQGLRSWQYSVAPKLQLLSDLLGSDSATRDLLISCPSVLKMPVESKLQPVLTALSSTAGLSGEQLAQLLRQCPAVLTQPKESVVSRVNFLIDAIGGDTEDLMHYPEYLLLSLADVIGPRYYFLARQGLVDDFSDASTGTLQLQRVMQPDLKTFLNDVVQVSGSDLSSVSSEYSELKIEWDNLLGWCADKAFSSLEGQVSSVYQDQLNLFYVLVQ